MPEWYEEWFDRAEYELVYEHRNEREATQLIDTIEKVVSPDPKNKILDVGCGRGRHAMLFAKRGYEVFGIDISAQSIRDAKVRAAQSELDVQFSVADMRVQQCNQCFDGVVNLFTAFGYFEDESHHQLALKSIAGALRSGGWFVQDFMNASFVRSTLVQHDERHQNGLSIFQERWIEAGRINKEITIVKSADSKQVFCESVRLLELSDFENMYEVAGLRIEKCLGDYSGQPFDETSPRLILIARKTDQ